MNLKIKTLINLIKGSLKAQIITGVASTVVVGAIVAGGIATYKIYHPEDLKINPEISMDGYNEDLERSDENAAKNLKISNLTDSISKKIPDFQLDRSGMSLDEIISKLEEVDNSGVTSLGIEGSNVVSKDTIVNIPNPEVATSDTSKPDTSTPKPEGSTPKPEEPATVAPTPEKPAPVEPTPAPPVSNEFKGFAYNLVSEGVRMGYVSGYNDYVSMFPQVSGKSTFSGLKTDVNRAVGALGQGAYPDKVKAKFMGKTYQGHVISNVIIETFHTPALDSNNDLILDNDFINSCGATNMVGGLFTSVIGKYQMDVDQGDMRYFKVTVVLD